MGMVEKKVGLEYKLFPPTWIRRIMTQGEDR
jgi:hypothetical protein